MGAGYICCYCYCCYCCLIGWAVLVSGAGAAADVEILADLVSALYIVPVFGTSVAARSGAERVYGSEDALVVHFEHWCCLFGILAIGDGSAYALIGAALHVVLEMGVA